MAAVTTESASYFIRFFPLTQRIGLFFLQRFSPDELPALSQEAALPSSLESDDYMGYAERYPSVLE